jgi:hypothetical protein
MAPLQPAQARREGGMVLPSLLCLALALGALRFALPHGLAVGGIPLPLPFEGALLLGAFAAGAYGAVSAREGRVLLGAVVGLALLAPAADPRLPVERLPMYLAAAVLYLLHVEFALLNAKMARLAKLPRAHVAHVGRKREVELRATAQRIAGSWPAPLAAAASLLVVAVLLQGALASVGPPPADSVEMRGPFGLVLMASAVLGTLGVVAWRRSGPRAAAPAPREQAD